ncbi:hypothetical protein GCM10027167_78050 [Nocardia heshunensis]
MYRIPHLNACTNQFGQGGRDMGGGLEQENERADPGEDLCHSDDDLRLTRSAAAPPAKPHTAPS